MQTHSFLPYPSPPMSILFGARPARQRLATPDARMGMAGRRTLRLSGIGALLLMGALAAAPQSQTAVTTPASATSSGAIPVDALVAEVVQSNPELEFYRAELAAAKAGQRQAGAWTNPELSGDIGSKRVWERHGPTLGDGVAWSVSVAQTFEFPGRISLRKAIANQQVELARIGLEHFEAALAARVRALAHALWAGQEKAAAAGEVAGRFQALLEVLVQREPAGVTPLLEMRIIEANAIALNRRASQATQEWKSALIELNQLRGRPADTPLTVSAQWSVPTNTPPLDALLDIARTRNFEVRLREAELAQQGFQVRLSRNERWPSVTVAPFYAAERADDEQRIVGVGVSVPLPLWTQNQGNIESAKARQLQAQAALDATLRQVERQMADHALALEALMNEMARWRADAQQQFREAAELADRHYRLGAVPVTTYVEMQTRYLDALESLLATRSEALEHARQLELLAGQSLDTVPRH